MEKNIFMELLAAREFKAIRSILNVMNAVDIASLLSEFEEKELAQAFRLIPKAKAAEVFANMSNATQSCLIDAFTETELKEIIDDMLMDDTVDLLEDLPANVVTRILSNINPQKRAQINILLDYPQDSAGSIMTTEYVSLKRTMTVKQAMAHIKEVGIHKETIYTCYVLEARRLVGIVTAKDLLVSDYRETLGELLVENLCGQRLFLCIREMIKSRSDSYFQNMICWHFRFWIPMNVWSESSRSMMHSMLWLMKRQRICHSWQQSIRVKNLTLKHRY